MSGVLPALMPDSDLHLCGRGLARDSTVRLIGRAEAHSSTALLVGGTATLSCIAYLIGGADVLGDDPLRIGTVLTPHSRVGLLRGALSESGNKEKYALVNITGRTEQTPRPTPRKKKVEPPFNSLHSVGPGLPVSKILKNKPHLIGINTQ